MFSNRLEKRFAFKDVRLPPKPAGRNLEFKEGESVEACSDHKHTLRFNGHFSRRTWVSRCLLFKAKDDGSGGDNWTTGTISRAKLQLNHHHQQTNTQFYRPDALPVAQPTVKALKEKYHIPWTCLPQAHLGVFQLCL